MEKTNQIIFMDGKETALKKLFGETDSPFGYLAVGYAEADNGFREPTTEQNNGFNEISATNLSYERIKLTAVSDGTTKDPDTGKVLVKFQATLNNDNINSHQNINQIAVVDRKDISEDTKYYCATTFPTFTKSDESSITFVIGFRL